MALISQLKLHKYRDVKLSISQYIFIFFSALFSLFVLNTSFILTGSALIYISLGIFIFSIIYIIFHPKVWVYTVVLVTGVFSSSSGGGISALDAVFALYFNLFLILWILFTIFIRKEKIVESRLEWMIIAFLFFTILTVINVSFERVEFLIWLKEYSLLTLMLFYFPLKKYIKTKQEIITLLICFVVTLVFCDLYQFYLYKTILSNITYAYEAGNSIRNNLYLYVVGATFSCIFIFYQKKTFYRMISLFLMVLTLGALASSFARIFWATAFLNISIIFLILQSKEKVRFLAYFFLSLLFAYIVASLLFGDIFKFVIFAIESRFQSTSKGATDISALSRFAEWEVVISKINESPFIGNGFGYPFTFKNPIVGFKGFSSTIHNNYLHFAFRIGIPLTILYFSIFITAWFRSIYLSIRIQQDLFYRVLMIATNLSLLSCFITSFFTVSFVFRDGLIINIILLFLVNYVHNNYRLKKLK